MMSIIDYGLGNIKAIQNVYTALGIKSQLVKKSSDLKKASKLILPGVGSFDYALMSLSKQKYFDDLKEMVTINKIPILGICVGMQIMCNDSEEGNLEGLGWFDGSFKSFLNIDQKNKIITPHMGWNSVNFKKNSRLFNGIQQNSFFYFLHSFYLESQIDGVISQTNYKKTFVSSFEFENIFGVQFHPEKSHEVGSKLLYNFASLS
jgi:glutamine amidotransferase